MYIDVYIKQGFEIKPSPNPFISDTGLFNSKYLIMQ